MGASREGMGAGGACQKNEAGAYKGFDGEGVEASSESHHSRADENHACAQSYTLRSRLQAVIDIGKSDKADTSEDIESYTDGN